MSYYTAESAEQHRTSHQAHIVAGLCPSVNRTKAWCNGQQGHAEMHHAPYMLSSGRREQTFWTDAEAEQCPCAMRQATEGTE